MAQQIDRPPLDIGDDKLIQITGKELRAGVFLRIVVVAAVVRERDTVVAQGIDASGLRQHPVPNHLAIDRRHIRAET